MIHFLRCKCTHVVGLHITFGFDLVPESYFERQLLCKATGCQCEGYVEMTNLEYVEFEARKQAENNP